jgi:hypothetical protein
MTVEAVPTVREELNRKTVEVLTTACQKTDVGRLPKRDLALIGQTLWQVTSGLVDNEVSHLVAVAADAAIAEPMKRHFIGKGTVRTVAWFPERAGYVVLSRDPNGQVLNTNKRSADVGEREVELSNLFAALEKAGYREL